MQGSNEQGQPLYQYVIPPMVEIPAGQLLLGNDPQDVQAKRGEFPLHLLNIEWLACRVIIPLDIANLNRICIWITRLRA
jgi:hypothetical protein